MSQSHISMSPRQKMINLMYIVLTAMLALNVSSDVLDGFTQVQDGLTLTNTNVASRNSAVMEQLAVIAAANPDKAGSWHRQAVTLREQAASLYSLVDSLKLAIVRRADGPEADVADITNRENLDAASMVMLNPVTRNGERLRHAVDTYRQLTLGMITDSVKARGIASMLSTEPRRAAEGDAMRPWEVQRFDTQPVVAAVALLTKLQSDLLYAEGEALASLLAAVDAGDVRVNSLNALVLPESRNVMLGTPYAAEIVLAAVDTTARPAIWVDGKRVESAGHYEFIPTGIGPHTYSGYMELPLPDGTVSRHEFSSEFNVIEPTATVMPTLMNVLYAGIDNPVAIAVPGFAPSGVNASMTGGTLTRTASGWVARPTPEAREAQITVTVDAPRTPRRQVAAIQFKVRPLPDPAAYIALGADKRYRGGKPVAKADLMAASGLGAAIDDGILDIDFRVDGFETVFFDSMGNAMPEVSDGARFSRRQIESIRRLQRGKRFFISRIRATGPDGTSRTLAPVEVLVN